MAYSIIIFGDYSFHTFFFFKQILFAYFEDFDLLLILICLFSFSHNILLENLFSPFTFNLSMPCCLEFLLWTSYSHIIFSFTFGHCNLFSKNLILKLSWFSRFWRWKGLMPILILLPAFLMWVQSYDCVCLRFGSPRSQLWAKDVLASCLFGKKVNKALVGEWEMIQGREGSQ